MREVGYSMFITVFKTTYEFRGTFGVNSCGWIVCIRGYIELCYAIINVKWEMGICKESYYYIYWQVYVQILENIDIMEIKDVQ